MNVEKLKQDNVFSHFYNICQIPHGSGEENAISQYLYQWARNLGYEAVTDVARTAVGIIFCAAAAGYGGAITNAFTTGVAQGIAGLPMFSGMNLRVPLFIVLLAVSILIAVQIGYGPF